MILSTSSGFLSAAAIAIHFLSLTIISPGLAFHLPAPSQSKRKSSAIIMSESAPQASSTPTAASTAATASLLPTQKFLSTLIHAALRGSQTISSLSDAARNGDIQFKEEGDARSALTIADTSAQRVIVSSILELYPALNMVGEEDESVRAEKEFAMELRNDLLDGYEWTTALPISSSSEGIDAGDDDAAAAAADEGGGPLPAELDMDKVVVYVDPLDGTREFVEGRLDNVQCLIGVCYEGVPIMGAVGLPFPLDKESNATEVVFGLAGRGIGKMCIPKKSSEDDAIVECALPEIKQYQSGGDNAIYISSGDSKSVIPAVDIAEKIFASRGGIERQILGATGNKLLKVVHGQTTLSLLHDKTSLWDTAAPTALLSAMGGKVTDYFGDPLVYDKKELRNKLGVVASAAGANSEHDAVTEAFRSDKAVLLSFFIN